MSRLASNPLGGLNGKHHAGRLGVFSARSHEGPHVRLRYPVPDHVTCVEIGSFAHCLAGCIVVQKLNHRLCYGGWILEGNQPPRPSFKSSAACQYGVEIIAFPAPKAYARVPDTACVSWQYGVT